MFTLCFRLPLLIALSLSARITEAQRSVGLIEIQSGGLGLGTAQNVDIIIRRKDSAFVCDGEPVDAAKVRALVSALESPPLANPDMENLCVTLAWLKAHVASQRPGVLAGTPPTTESQRDLFTTSFTNPELIAKLLPGLFS